MNLYKNGILSLICSLLKNLFLIHNSISQLKRGIIKAPIIYIIISIDGVIKTFKVRKSKIENFLA